MAIEARFAHTNLIAEDWHNLVAFYRDVFGCEQLNPAKKLSDPWVAKITGVAGAVIRVAHLRLPGHGDTGPTLEVITYVEGQARQKIAADLPGYSHIAFTVDDVEAARDAVLAAGGSCVGELVTVDIPNRGRLREIYVADPEGNIIELHNWS